LGVGRPDSLVFSASRLIAAAYSIATFTLAIVLLLYFLWGVGGMAGIPHGFAMLFV
jgi:hypothetical protein